MSGGWLVGMPAFCQVHICTNYAKDHVGELIVSNYVAVSINNWLQDVLAAEASVSCVQFT